MRAKYLLLVGLGGFLCGAPSTYAQPNTDNSGINKRDQSVVEVTAGQQGSSKADMETTRQIRKAIIGHHELSTYAHNVKIITNDGRVVLKGPVRNRRELTTIEKVAGEVAGPGNVTNEMQIASGE